MRIFGIAEANHYCSTFSAQPGWAERSPREFLKNRLAGSPRTLNEGSQLYEEYKSCSLRDVERGLFLAASHYRRFLDLVIGSSAPWAQVTAYYGSFFAAKAILGMFGAATFNKKVIDVHLMMPGQQALRIRSIGSGVGKQSTTYQGTHQQFWDLFYDSVHTLSTQIPPRLAVGLSPVSANPIWQTQERNKVNYYSDRAIDLSAEFYQGFSPSSFPTSLPGTLITQFRIMEALVELAFVFASNFSLSTDALNSLTARGNLREAVKSLIYHSYAPSLVQKTIKASIT